MKSRELLDRRVGVYWPVEQRYFFGTVASFNAETEMHYIKYDDGDQEYVDLNDEIWVLVEDGDPRSTRFNHEDGDTALRDSLTKATKDDFSPAMDVRDPLRVVGGPVCVHGAKDQSQGPATAVNPPAKEEEEVLVEGDTYQVYRTTSGTPGYEIYSSFEGYAVCEISVRAFSLGEVHLKAESTSRPPVTETVKLPSRIDNKSAQALFTETGQLYVRVAEAGG